MFIWRIEKKTSKRDEEPAENSEMDLKPIFLFNKETNLGKGMLFENGIERKETEDMDLVRKDTAFDGKDNGWLAFAMQQAEFYRSANQLL